MKQKDVELFEKLHSQIEALHAEVGALSKKTPDGAMNVFKLGIINSILKQANRLLTGAYQPLADFKAFDEDNIPTNSDVTLVLAQYLNCMETLRADNVEKGRFQDWYWLIDGEKSSVGTAPPKKLRGK